MINTTNEAHDHRALLKQIARQAMVDYGLLPEFSQAAIGEAERARPAREAAVSDRGATSSAAPLRDLRDRLWCSIDNDDSRDLDQLTVSAPEANGTVRILIAVADVDAIVEAGSAIDAHARQNTTSVYTPAEIFPMLPERLSTNLTSLAFGEDRHALVVDFVIDAQGSTTEATVYRAIVNNHAKLAYNSAAAWLEGEGPIPEAMAAVPGMAEQVRAQDAVAQRLRKARLERGALDFQTIEARPVFDGNAVRDLTEERDNRARNLIEDFMIAANSATAQFLATKDFPSIRRVVRSPERWDRLEALAAEYGTGAPAIAAFSSRCVTRSGKRRFGAVECV
jgi:VacB/RNase II family 3'-5' exoribonuclease